MSRFGIRRRVKGAVKRALGVRPEPEAPPAPPPREATPAPAPASSSPSPKAPAPAPAATQDGPLFARNAASGESPGKGRIFVQVKGLRPDDVLRESVRPVEIFGRRYALARTGDGGFYALADRCPHAAGSLGEGSLDGTELACSMHGWTFDVTNGECTSGEESEVATFEVKVEDDKIFVETPS